MAYGGASATQKVSLDALMELLANQAGYDALVAGEDPRRIAQDWQEGLDKFQLVRQKYLIYK